MPRIYKNIEKLKEVIAKKEESYKKACDESTRKFANIGFGSNMRGYKKVSSLSYRKEDKLRDDLKELYQQLENLEKNTNI